MIDKGMDRPAIIAVYRAKFGEKILSAPTTEGCVSHLNGSIPSLERAPEPPVPPPGEANDAKLDSSL